MQLYQSHVVFRSFSDLYSEEKRQEEIRSNKSTASSSNYSSRASSFSESAGSMLAPYPGYKLSRNSTNTSIESDSASSQYYPAALYNSKMAQRESDTVTLNDDASLVDHRDLSLRRF